MYKPLLIFFLTLTMTDNSTGQTPKEIILAQKVLEAFKTKSFEAYKQVLINHRDFEEFVTDIQQHDQIQRQDDWKYALEKFDEQADSTYQAQFKRLLEKGEGLSIDWAEVTFSDFVYHISNAANSSKTLLNGHINFMCKGKNYTLFGLEATELSSGYKVSMLRTVQKGDIKEYVDPDLMDDEDL